MKQGFQTNLSASYQQWNELGRESEKVRNRRMLSLENLMATKPKATRATPKQTNPVPISLPFHHVFNADQVDGLHCRKYHVYRKRRTHRTRGALFQQTGARSSNTVPEPATTQRWIMLAYQLCDRQEPDVAVAQISNLSANITAS